MQKTKKAPEPRNVEATLHQLFPRVTWPGGCNNGNNNNYY